MALYAGVHVSALVHVACPHACRYICCHDRCHTRSKRWSGRTRHGTFRPAVTMTVVKYVVEHGGKRADLHGGMHGITHSRVHVVGPSRVPYPRMSLCMELFGCHSCVGTMEWLELSLALVAPLLRRRLVLPLNVPLCRSALMVSILAYDACVIICITVTATAITNTIVVVAATTVVLQHHHHYHHHCPASSSLLSLITTAAPSSSDGTARSTP